MLDAEATVHLNVIFQYELITLSHNNLSVATCRHGLLINKCVIKSGRRLNVAWSLCQNHWTSRFYL